MASGSRILVVDDEALIAAQLGERLESMGYVIAGTAGSGEECLRLCRELAPDLVLLDIVMPGTMDGIAAASLVLRDHAIPVVFVTAFSDERTLARAGEVSPYGFVVKPFRAEQVRAAVECALARHRREGRSGLAGDVDRLLLREAHHRFSNNLAALANLLEFEGAGTGEPHAVLEECRERLRAVSRIHRQFCRSRNAETVDFAAFVTELAGGLERTFARHGRGIRIVTGLESVSMTYDLVRHAGLLVNELVVNALKYAFPDVDSGEIRIAFHVEDGTAVLAVSDNGCGSASPDPAAEPGSLGLQLVAMMVRQLKGTIERQSGPAGTAVTVRFPMPFPA